MNRSLSQFFTIAAYELVDAFRSRRAIILLVIYFLGSITACGFFINALHKAEVALVESMGLEASDEPGKTTETLWKSRGFKNILRNLVGRNKLVDELLKIPPIALFYGSFSLMFVALLVVLLSSSRIAEEVSTASVRFVLFRTSRSVWCLGKFAGQAVLLLLALLFSAGGAWIAGWIGFKSFDMGGSAQALILSSCKTWLYGFAWLGFALGISLVSRTPAIATSWGLGGMLGMTIVYFKASRYYEDSSWPVWDMIRKMTPGGHRMGLWNSDMAEFMPSAIMLLVMGLVYFLIGFAFFARRDQ